MRSPLATPLELIAEDSWLIALMVEGMPLISNESQVRYPWGVSVHSGARLKLRTTFSCELAFRMGSRDHNSFNFLRALEIHDLCS